MRNINRLAPNNYLFLTAVFAVWAMIVYRATIFRCLFLNTFNESKAKLWIIWGICLVLGYLLTRKRRRNYFSIFTNTILPFGIYSVMAYDDVHYTVAAVIGYAILILCGAFYLAVILTNNLPKNFDEALIILKRSLLHCINGTKSIVAVCLSVLVIYIIGLYAFDVPSIIPAVKPSVTVEEDKTEVLEKNLPMIANIDKSIWKNITFEEKLDTLQTIANVERVHLGISHEINVRTENLGLGIYGSYDYTSHTVYIHSELLDSDDSNQCVSTLCHELRHAYQHDVTDAYLSLSKAYQQLEIFDNVRNYYENLDDYQSATADGFEKYENQTVEVDSREYSDYKAPFYFRAIDKYLSENA